MTIDILQKIKTYKIEEIKLAKLKVSFHVLEEEALSQPPTLEFENTLRIRQKDSYGIIAEIKKASPSKGIIRKNFNVGEIARAYENGGASCLSVLTDFNSFMGHNHYIKEARNATSLPILRKDFLYDPYQVVETRAIGADCILIIMATVSDQQAMVLEDSAIQLGLDVLIEVHNEIELERALRLKSKFIGLNNRNLKDFKIDLKATTDLVAKIPKDYLIVSESGLNNRTDLKNLAKQDVRSFLIGESLMRQKNVEYAIKKLLQK